jgi:hypothetical protein
MRKTILAAAAVAAVLSIGATANKAAAAMPTAAPTQLGLATSDDASLVQKAAIVCGYYGCRRVWWGGGPHWGHPYWGWHRHWGWRRW